MMMDKRMAILIGATVCVVGAAVAIGRLVPDVRVKGAEESWLSGAKTHDFGRLALVDQSMTVTHRFVLTNNTSDRLNINDVVSSCGCTVAQPSTRSLDPGDTLELAVSLKLTRPGRYNETVWVQFDGNRVSRSA